MIAARVRELIRNGKNAFSYNMNLFSLDETIKNNTEYVVGATRLGFLSKPVWCPSHTPLDVSMFPIDLMTSNTDQDTYNILIRFTSLKKIITWKGKFNFVGCESLLTQ
jgi:hypothetical protein